MRINKMDPMMCSQSLSSKLNRSLRAKTADAAHDASPFDAAKTEVMPYMGLELGGRRCRFFMARLFLGRRVRHDAKSGRCCSLFLVWLPVKATSLSLKQGVLVSGNVETVGQEPE